MISQNILTLMCIVSLQEGYIICRSSQIHVVRGLLFLSYRRWLSVMDKYVGTGVSLSA